MVFSNFEDPLIFLDHGKSIFATFHMYRLLYAYTVIHTNGHQNNTKINRTMLCFTPAHQFINFFIMLKCYLAQNSEPTCLSF
jgi:hypothetical protein